MKLFKNALMLALMIFTMVTHGAVVIFQFQDNYGRATTPAVSLTPLSVPLNQSGTLVISGMTTFRWPTNGLAINGGSTNFFGWTNGQLVLPLSGGGYQVQVSSWPRSWGLTVPDSTNTFYAGDLSSNMLILGPQPVTINGLTNGPGGAYDGSLLTNVTAGAVMGNVIATNPLAINQPLMGTNIIGAFGNGSGLKSTWWDGALPYYPGSILLNDQGWTVTGGPLNADAGGLFDIPASGLVGTIASGRMPAFSGDFTTSAGSIVTTLKNTGTAGTYTKTTFDSQGRETSGAQLSMTDLPPEAQLAPTNSQSSVSFNGGAVAITNQLYAPYDDSFKQETTNLLSPLGTHDWMYAGVNAIASYHGGEVYINEAQVANNPGYECLFALPPGATGVTFSGNIRTLSGSTAGNVYMGLDDHGTWYGRVDPNITTSWQSFSCSMVQSDIVGSSSNLAAKIFIVGTYQLSVSNLTISFTGGGNSVLNQPFKRYMVKPQNLLSESGNPRYDVMDKVAGVGWENVNQSRAGNHSILDFKTDANVADIEVSCFANIALGSQWPLVVYENGTILTNLFPANSPFLAHFLLPLGTSNVFNTVRIVSSFNFYNYGGNYCRAVIIPQTNHMAFANNFTLKTVLLIGDSILADNNSSDGMQDVGHLIESYLPVKVINYCQGSGGLYNSWSESDQGIPEKTILAGVLASTHPDDIIMEHGINDLGGSTGYNTNGYMADLADFIDTAHSYCPWATIYVQAILGTNGYINGGTAASGMTLSQFWDAQKFVAQSRSSYCIFLNATNWLTSADIKPDNIHPTSSGEVKYAWNLIQNLWTNRIVVTGESIKNTTNRWAGSFNGGFLFGSTNAAPGSTTPKVWLPVTNNGAVYLIGGCQ